MNSSPIKSVVDSLERNGPMDKAEYTRQKVPEKLRMTDDPEKIAMIWQEVAIVCDKILFTVLILITFVAWLYVLTSFLLML